jgi:hypothetical protein
MEVAVEHGIDPRTCLAETGLALEPPCDSTTEVQASQELSMVPGFIVRTEGLIGLTREVGMRYNLANTGILGYALLASPTINDAVNLARRFATLAPWDLGEGMGWLDAGSRPA